MKTLFNIFFVLLFSCSLSAQNIGINSTGAAPDNSSMLDVASTDKGVLVPRVNISDLNTAAPITAPSTSLLVYNTNVTSGVGFYFWDGLKWVKLEDANSNPDEDWLEVGGVLSPNDINDDIYTLGNVGIGTNLPTRDLVIGNDVIQLSSANDVSTTADILFKQNGLISSEAGTLFSIDSDNDTENEKFEFIKDSEGFTGSTLLLEIEEDGDIVVPRGNELVLGGGGVNAVGRETLYGFANAGKNQLAIGSRSNIWLSIDRNNGSNGEFLAIGKDGHSDTSSTWVDIMRVMENGNVGIGTTAPSQRLHVIGNILASGTITSSDARYKTEIAELKNSSDAISQMKPVSYSFKDDYIKKGQFDNKLHFGLIAQDLEKVLPNLVYEDKDGYKAINYTEIIALLIKSNQELQKRIEELEKD